ncbi:MAG TPA: hypothetical protein VJK51_02275 [Candidatus Nanoarchaeia archaeon]|nr:hypothetical protein [Candidatus Nanoarchaeia archaeon]
MPNCPNCSYPLVLIERRRKYKCAKCGKLFSQKDIESKEFKEWNKKQRENDKLDAKRESNMMWAREKRDKRDAKVYMREWRKKNKEKISQNKEKYYEKNRGNIIQKKREYRLKLSEQQKKEQNEKRKARRYSNIEATRLITRINYWRQQQKALALQMYENELSKAYNSYFDNFLPSLEHSYLQPSKKPLKTPFSLTNRRRP